VDGMEAIIGIVEINSDGFEVEAREEETGRRRFGGRNNGDGAALHFPLPLSVRGRMTAVHCVAAQRERRLSVGALKVGDIGPVLGRSGPVVGGLGKMKNGVEARLAANENGPKSRGLQNKPFQILNRILDSKSNDSNIFKLVLNWVQTGINSNKLFGDFSNLKLFKISLNIQI
jgi:hypothetical protein